MPPRRDDRRLRRSRRFLLRQATGPLRALPAFFVYGGMKCGTSSLFAYICQHPHVRRPYRKETHYFSLGMRMGRSEAWYRAHFPLRARMRRGEITGEATPGYLFETEVAARVARLVPKARLLIILRDPVERALSHYFHEVRMGRERLSLEEAMACEEERLELARSLGPEGKETLLHAGYKQRGLYADQIENVLTHFRREQVLVLGSGTLFRQPHVALADAFRFLELSAPETPLDFTAKNTASNRTAAPPRMVEELRRFFAPHNERLFALLGRELDW
ncbi:MAG: sulfotransferase domain-containing protein [Opitutales bacterium]